MAGSPHLPLFSSRRRSSKRFKVKNRLGLVGSVIWLCGFFVITVYLYLIIQRKQQNLYERSDLDGGGGGEMDITIFAAPRPFSFDGGLDLVGTRQELAVRSWLALSFGVSVVLFGQHASVLRLASSLGPRVTVETGIDFTFLGTPFFHSMVARSQASRSSISVLIDPEIILLPNIVTTLQHAQKLNHSWFLVSMSSNIAHFPFHLDNTGKHWLHNDGEKVGSEKLQDFLVQRQHWSNCGDRLLMAWNTGNLPLHAGVIPPFLYGKGLHNEWLVNEVLSSDFRLVIDASLVISSFYPESLGQQFNNYLMDSVSDDGKKWAYRGNHHLAELYGSLYFQQSRTLPFKIVKCLEHYLLIDLAKNTVFSLQGTDGHSSLSMKAMPGEIPERTWLSTMSLSSWRKKKWTACMKDINLLHPGNQCSVMDWFKVYFEMLQLPLIFPFSLESLLAIIADKDKSVVLAVAGDNYKDMLMSWVCRLRHLAVKNFIVCALDPEIYQFSVMQGLPVFMDPLAPSNISFNDCHFGTECFQEVTKVKSRIVLQILKLGYNVLMSDVDVYWFDNPLPFLSSFGPAVLAAQSDEYNETVPINLPRRFNSGFYFARADPATIAAVQKVVKHASMSELSEQPSFYDILCGEGGVNRVGDDQCFEPDTNLTVVFLDRNSFPNGAYKGLWEKRDVRSACMKLGCIILHNNWISGRKRKLERQVLSGLWDYDPSSRMCLQSWHRTLSMSYF